jgi:PA domain-containing protein
MSTRHLLRRLALAVIVIGAPALALAQSPTQGHILIINGNLPNVGFNDPTPVAPVGGNTGTTLGQQRLLAFQHAADLWDAELDTNVDVKILATFEPLTCTATGAVLGSAGATNVFRDFGANGLYPGVEFPGTWYPTALADKRIGFDILGFIGSTAADIRARFNVNLGQPGCLPTRPWYLGFDGNEGNGIDLVAVLLHEFGHGLGFQQFAGQNGRYLGGSPTTPGFPDVFNRRIFDNTQNLFWLDMTEAQRAASSINPRNVVFVAPETNASVPLVLRGTPSLIITEPANIAGIKLVGTAQFGAALTAAGVTAQIRIATDAADAAGPLETDGCSPIINAAQIAGRIALIDRGMCAFTVKAKNAQDAGAAAVLIANNVAGAAPGLAGADPTVTIPVASVSQADGNAIKTALLTNTVSAFLGLDETRRAGADTLERPLLYTPNPFEPGSSVSHYDTSGNPNQLMEPFINADLTHNVKPPFDLTLPLLHDIGWFPDTDVDGVANTIDACPSASDQRATIFVGPTDTTVGNVIFTNGCTVNDLITLLADGSKNHGQFVSGVAHLLDALVAGGFITEEEKERIQRTAAQFK